MAEEIRVMIVDDHPLFRQGLRNILEAQEDISIVGEATDGVEAINMAQELLPDVIVMDINLPTLNGLQATRRIKASCPQINIIMLTAYDDEEQVYHAIRAGASSYYAKDVRPKQLLEVIRQVSRGLYVVGDEVLTEDQIGDWLLREFRRFGGEVFEDQFFAPLSPRETEILKLVIQGMSNRQIAYHLGISHQTVKNHMTSILSKLGVGDRTQAAVYALRHGWVPLHEKL